MNDNFSVKMIDQSAEHPEQLAQQACALQRAGARLLCMTASDERDREPELGFCLHTFWLKDGQVTYLHCALGSDSDLAYPSLTPQVTAAYWYEREIYDLFGIKAVGHPNPSRLVVHDDWPAEIYPMRKDYQGPLPERVGQKLHAAPAQGGQPQGSQPNGRHSEDEHTDLPPDGLVRIPVGPVHAGIIEPGHFHFTAVGEEVFALEPQFSYVHRGLEKAAEGRTPTAALALAERVCGVCTVAHSWSFCQAVEQLAGAVVPERAELIRVILGELERLHNHVGDIGNICAGAGLAVANNHGLYLRERLMRLNETLFGHRFLRGCIVPGGVCTDLDSRMLDRTIAELEYVVQEAAALAAECVEHDIFRNRMTGTGVLERDLAAKLGVTGVAARASGVARDTRADLAYGGYARYERLPFAIQTEQTGDVKARFLVRTREIEISLAIIREAFEMLQPGAIQEPVGPISKAGIALGATESARGENIHLLMVDEHGTIRRWFVRSASYTNWPAVALAVPGNIVPDFPIINKSFELCYACLDR
ncbi:MAG TPA: NADH-quinone oxidoreductase subunit F [Firmicutes bacterium]|jgi:Ni,Fe-hydrogenase III large subunit/Ni,Fe-hydrogenase III component G|nr:NADH-quinone oxidoreductase subunit F [Bacillota bacterium]HBR25205.1 NADH-quinone oxidoreductase subunit F [Bacillota bacterium]